MKKFLKTFILLTLFSFLAVWLANHPGQIDVRFLGYHLEFSIIAFLVFFIALSTALFFLYMPIHLGKYVKRSFKNRSLNALQKEMNGTLCSLLEGEKIPAEKALKKALFLFPENPLGQTLLTALISEKKTDGALLYKKEETKLLGLKFLIEEDFETGDISSAYHRAKEAFNLDKKKTWVLKALFKAAFLYENYDKAREILRLLFKQDKISKETFEDKEALLFYKQGLFEKAFNKAPIESLYCLSYVQSLKDTKKADKILAKAFETNPSFEIYETYLSLHNTEETLVLLKNVERLFTKGKEDKISLLISAKIALKAHLWGEARQTLEKYQALYPLTKDVALEMAALEREENKDEDEALLWEEKALELDRKDKETSKTFFIEDIDL